MDENVRLVLEKSYELLELQRKQQVLLEEIEQLVAHGHTNGAALTGPKTDAAKPVSNQAATLRRHWAGVPVKQRQNSTRNARIMRLLNKEKRPLSARQIAQLVGEQENVNAVAVAVSTLKKAGKLRYVTGPAPQRKGLGYVVA